MAFAFTGSAGTERPHWLFSMLDQKQIDHFSGEARPGTRPLFRLENFKRLRRIRP